LDGHSFSLLGLESPAAEGVVEVEAVTPRTMLVPREVFEPAAAEALLAAAGIVIIVIRKRKRVCTK
jgi:hypothetical protein